MALIVLNGASSAGKTSLAAELARRLGPDTVVTGFDAILARLRHRHLLFARRSKLLIAVHKAAERESCAGTHVVVETTLLTRRALQDFERRLRPHGALLIGVKPPLSVSERWEAERIDRRVGHARRHYELVHHELQPSYDLVLDTSRLSPAEAAEEVLSLLAAG